MIPNASDYARRRHTILVVVRLLALLPLAVALVPLTSWFAEGISDGDFTDVGYYMDRIVIAAVMIVAAVVLFLVAGPVTRLVAGRPRKLACPYCDYAIEGLTEPRCPECGLALTREFMGLPPDETAGGRAERPVARPGTGPDELVRRRTLYASWVRLLGVVLLPVALPALLIPFGVAAVMITEGDRDWPQPFVIALTLGGPMLTCAVVFLFKGMLVAKLIVPADRAEKRQAAQTISTAADRPMTGADGVGTEAPAAGWGGGGGRDGEPV